MFALFSDPLAAILTKKLALRKVQLLGCIISLLGIGCAGFSTRHWHVVISFGIVAGRPIINE